MINHSHKGCWWRFIIWGMTKVLYALAGSWGCGPIHTVSQYHTHQIQDLGVRLGSLGSQKPFRDPGAAQGEKYGPLVWEHAGHESIKMGT